MAEKQNSKVYKKEVVRLGNIQRELDSLMGYDIKTAASKLEKRLDEWNSSRDPKWVQEARNFLNQQENFNIKDMENNKDFQQWQQERSEKRRKLKEERNRAIQARNSQADQRKIEDAREVIQAQSEPENDFYQDGTFMGVTKLEDGSLDYSRAVNLRKSKSEELQKLEDNSQKDPGTPGAVLYHLQKGIINNKFNAYQLEKNSDPSLEKVQEAGYNLAVQEDLLKHLIQQTMDFKEVYDSTDKRIVMSEVQSRLDGWLQAAQEALGDTEKEQERQYSLVAKTHQDIISGLQRLKILLNSEAENKK